MRRIMVLLAVALLAAGFAGCSKDDKGDDTPPQARSTSADVRSYEKWVYFSFTKGWVAEPADFANDPGWDIAFHRWDVRTNGGASGKGQGGAYMLTQTSLENLPAPVASSVKSDGMILTYMKAPDMSGENDQRVEVPASAELSQWMSVGMGTTPPSYTMARNVFVVRAADGTYGAIRFTNYMNDKAVKGYASFEYIYPIQ